MTFFIYYSSPLNKKIVNGNFLYYGIVQIEKVHGNIIFK